MGTSNEDGDAAETGDAAGRTRADGPDRRLDARTVDGEPFGAITDALDALGPAETLLLINSFEPQPLYDVLERRGFTYQTEQVDGGEWHVSITHA